MAETPDVEGILVAFRAEMAAAGDAKALDTVRRAYTGKKSALKAALKRLRHVAPEDRPKVAQAVNAAQKKVEAELADAAAHIEQEALAAQLDAEWQDLSLPGLAVRRGRRHPLTVVEDRCMDVMRLLGFERVDGPEVEHPYYNFSLSAPSIQTGPLPAAGGRGVRASDRGTALGLRLRGRGAHLRLAARPQEPPGRLSLASLPGRSSDKGPCVSYPLIDFLGRKDEGRKVGRVLPVGDYCMPSGCPEQCR